MADPVIGILGAGRIGTALARLAVKAGYDVGVATAKPPAEIALLLEFTAPGARAETAADLVAGSDMVILALPLGKYRMLDPAAFAGKITVDAMNYWPQTEGNLPEFDSPLSSSEIIQAYLPQARVVRAFNHMGYHEFEQDARPAGDVGRRAMALAGNDDAANAVVAELVSRIGFDPVVAGDLRASRCFGIGTPIFGAGANASELAALLARRIEAILPKD